MLAASFPSFDTVSLSMAPVQQDPTAQVAEKVMRRIEIAKVARNLQDCLAFASFKAQNGWQDRTLSTIEPEITEKLARRKRPYHDDLHTSDSSSTFSDTPTFTSSQPLPSMGPAQSYAQSRKRVRASSNSVFERVTAHSEWRPAKPAHPHNLSPMLEKSNTVNTTLSSLEDSPMFDAPSASDDEDHESGMPPMEPPSSSIVSSSPPRTPLPASRRNLASTKQAGADLLLYLANSPRTPAIHVHQISSSTKNPPCTPPHQHSDLPSSMLQTPGNLNLFNDALQTPGNFNLSEFCNVTPSPAAAQFGHYSTHDLGRTPSRTTRRSLNFDALAPPTPTTQRRHTQGLALQLGEALDR